jgi:hypothetical protein
LGRSDPLELIPRMTGIILSRTVRRRCQAAMIWAMMPVMLLNGKSLSGCLSPTGHFEAGCHCQAMQLAKVSTDPQATTTCRCPCCKGKTCCCAGGSCCKAKSHDTVASYALRPKGSAVQDGAHCRPYSIYVVASVVTNSAHLDHSVLQAIVSINSPLSVVAAPVAHHFELNTGPPPDNLVVELHRFLI